MLSNMTTSELLKQLSRLNTNLTSVIRQSGYDRYDDLSGISADWDDPDDYSLILQFQKVMEHLETASDIISYLVRPVKGESILYKNSAGRYECEYHIYTCGDIIEYYVTYDDRSFWVVSSVEHDREDYYVVGSKRYSSDGKPIRLDNLRVRFREL